MDSEEYMYTRTRTSTGWTKKKDYFYKQTNTSYSETTILLDVEICLLGVLMSTSCWQISTSNRIVVSEYEVFVCL